jgi:hypothetical protein
MPVMTNERAVEIGREKKGNSKEKKKKNKCEKGSTL